MKGEEKTKEQLIEELAEMRQRVAESEASEAERKRAEEALHFVHRKLRATFNAIQDLINVVDLDFNLTDVNDPLIKAFGLPDRESVLGRKCFEALKGRKDLCPSCAVAEAYRTKAPAYRTTTPEDEASTGGRSFEIFAYPVIDEQGNLSGAVEFARDITERKRAEEERERLLTQVEQERDKLETLINSIADEVWFCDAEGNLTLVNIAAARGIGFERAEEVCQPMPEWLSELEIYTPDGRPRTQKDAPLLRSLRGETLKDIEEIVRHPKSGEMLYRQVSSAPLRAEAGQIMGAVAVVRDITERKRAEEALSESEASYRELADSIADVFFAMDKDLKYMYWNRASEELTGIPAKDAIGKSLYDLFPDTPQTRKAEGIYRDVLRT